MRAREDIEADVGMNASTVETERELAPMGHNITLLLEVLLDNRELLDDIKGQLEA